MQSSGGSDSVPIFLLGSGSSGSLHGIVDALNSMLNKRCGYCCDVLVSTCPRGIEILLINATYRKLSEIRGFEQRFGTI